VIALGLYGVVATAQPSNEFERILAAYGGVFIIGPILWDHVRASLSRRVDSARDVVSASPERDNS